MGGARVGVGGARVGVSPDLRGLAFFVHRATAKVRPLKPSDGPSGGRAVGFIAESRKATARGVVPHPEAVQSVRACLGLARLSRLPGGRQARTDMLGAYLPRGGAVEFFENTVTQVKGQVLGFTPTYTYTSLIRECEPYDVGQKAAKYGIVLVNALHRCRRIVPFMLGLRWRNNINRHSNT